MDSESDWDTQSEAAGSPRHSGGSVARLENFCIAGKIPEEREPELFIDYSQPVRSGAQDNGNQQPVQQPYRSTNQQSRQNKSSNQNASIYSGVDGQASNSLHQSDEDNVSVDTVIQRPGSRSGSARTPRVSRDNSRTNQRAARDNTGTNQGSSRENLGTSQRALRDNEPPYDFSRAYKPESAYSRHSERGSRPGKERKGTTYDPSPLQDEDDDVAVLAELRAGVERGKQIEEEVRRQQLLENQRKQMELKSELEDLAKDDPATKDKVLARMSSLASKLKGGSKKSKPVNSAQAAEGQVAAPKPNVNTARAVEGEVRTAEPLVFEDTDRSVMIFPFEEVEKDCYRTTAVTNSAVLPAVADRVERAMTRLWQELFALLRILTSLVFVLLIEFTLYILRDVIYGVVLRIVAIAGDYVFKATLSTIFNGFLQPSLVFVWNVLIGVRHALEPIISLVRGISQQVAVVLGAFRLVEISHNNPQNYPYNNNYAYSEYSDGVENV